MKRELKLDAKIIDYELRRNKLSKHIRLTVSGSKGLVVTIPFGVSVQSVEEVMRQKQEWILQQLSERKNQLAQEKQAWEKGDNLFFRGKPFPLIIREADISGFKVEFDQLSFKIKMPLQLPRQLQNEGIKKALSNWYIKQAKEVIPLRTAEWAEHMNIQYNRITIKDLTSRWGSCSQLHNLNFNFRLVLAPIPVLDYVIIHELCHIKQLNHSQLFWRQVEMYCPDYKQHKRWLKENSDKLYVV